jgi:hypothetical protein
MPVTNRFLVWAWADSNGRLADHWCFDIIEPGQLAFAAALPESAVSMMEEEIEGRLSLDKTLRERYKSSLLNDEPLQSRQVIAYDLLLNKAAGQMGREFINKVKTGEYEKRNEPYAYKVGDRKTSRLLSKGHQGIAPGVLHGSGVAEGDGAGWETVEGPAGSDGEIRDSGMTIVNGPELPQDESKAPEPQNETQDQNMPDSPW